MNITLHLKYTSNWGEKVYVCYADDANSFEEKGSFPLTYIDDVTWSISFIREHNTPSFSYYYFIVNEDGTHKYSAIKQDISYNVKNNNIVAFDHWCGANELFSTSFTTPFMHTFLISNNKNASALLKDASHYFTVKAPQLKLHETVCIVGNDDKIGNWDTAKLKLLKRVDNNYVVGIHFPFEEEKIVYKYCIFNTKTKTFVDFEKGENRVLLYKRQKKELIYINDVIINFEINNWKGAGVAIPVFSLKSSSSFGVGEFTDIKLLANWSKKVGIKMIQLLPINDTIITKTNCDSYPYSANSSFALHPMYINLNEVGKLPKDNKVGLLYARKQRKLNGESVLNYEAVIKYKLAYLKEVFLQDTTFLQSEKFELFFAQNKNWLVPYAAYCYLRDKNKNVDFSTWGKYATITTKQLEKLTDSFQKQYIEISFWYFVQYHLHTQLKNTVDFVHKLGIIIKGDIPIGIGRTSCDAWLYPHLFNMNMQAGAPPDDFAVKGQNWGFPTYNWEAMQKDSFKWWKDRFEKMSDYFDAFRIDHILGFFRIWSIPITAIEGIMGHFVPAIPVFHTELQDAGIHLDYKRLCNPYITENYLEYNFDASQIEKVKETFFNKNEFIFTLKEDFNTQKKVADFFAEQNVFDDNYKIKLFDCLSNVILFEEENSNGKAFHFNIAMEKTFSFSELNRNEQGALKKLFVNYFYERQNDFWKIEANKKLPSIKHSTNMLVCGEDLGMVPNCVPGVMEELSMLSLEVQRMPKSSGASFVNLHHVPYLSVATPSTHDMSTIRAWWEEDRNVTQNFYNNSLGNYGEAPQFCEPWVVKQIINQHLTSPSMLSVFQLQDLMGIQSSTRRENPLDDRINEPSNPNHYWCYRMHIKLEDLIKQKDFNETLGSMIKESGR